MDELFPELDPPPGGLHALRQRLEEPRSSSLRWAWLAPLAAAAVALIVWWTQPPAPETGVRGLEHTAVQQVLSTDEVVMVRVASTRLPSTE